jgi:methionine-rich copper-binding protein CopC
MSNLSRLILGLAAGTLVVSPAGAHPRLTAANPAPGAVVGHIGAVQLQFSERLVPAFSGGELIMTGMPGVIHHRPTPLPVRSAVASDGRTLVLTSAGRLPTGTYRLNWHAVSTDTHRVAGGFTFAVR